MQYNYHKNNVPPGPPVTPNNTFGGVKHVYIIAVVAVLFIALVVLFFSLTYNPSTRAKPLEITKSPATNIVTSSSKPQNYFKKNRKQMPDIPVTLSSIKLLNNSNEIDLT